MGTTRAFLNCNSTMHRFSKAGLSAAARSSARQFGRNNVQFSRSFTGGRSRTQWSGTRKAGAGAFTVGTGMALLSYAADDQTKCDDNSGALIIGAAATAVAAGAGYFLLSGPANVEANKLDWAAIRNDIIDNAYEDGDNGPLLVRLSWHASGTYHKDEKNGGSDGASMRFAPESEHGANAGLGKARKLLEPIKAKYPGLTYADLWAFAAAVAIEEMSGGDCKIPFRPGRPDATSNAACTPDGRLPDATQGADHLRQIFYKMGFNDKDIVTLSGAHTLGECHKDRSGFVGPWTRAPTTFSNAYYTTLLDETWEYKPGSEPRQFQDKATGELMMLPTDICLLQDKAFAPWVTKYANDTTAFYSDFSKAFVKLQELGCKSLGAPVKY